MKLNTLIDGYQMKCRVQELTLSQVIRVISLPNFCNYKLVRSISQKVLKISK